MLSVFINIIIVLSIIIPVAYLMVGKNNTHSQISIFKTKAKNIQLESSKVEIIGDCILGYSKNKKCIFYSDKENMNVIIQIELDSIKNIQISKTYGSDQMLNEIDLIIQTQGSKNHTLPVFRKRPGRTPGTSLQDAEEWKVFITKLSNKIPTSSHNTKDSSKVVNLTNQIQ